MGWEVNEDGSYCRSAPRSCSCPETIALPVIIASGVSWPSALSILMNYGIVPCPKLAREKGTLCKLVLGRLKLAVLRVTPFLYFTVCTAMKTFITRWKYIFHESTNVPCDRKNVFDVFTLRTAVEDYLQGVWWNVVLEGTGSKYNPQHDPERRNEIWT